MDAEARGGVMGVEPWARLEAWWPLICMSWSEGEKALSVSIGAAVAADGRFGPPLAHSTHTVHTHRSLVDRAWGGGCGVTARL